MEGDLSPCLLKQREYIARLSALKGQCHEIINICSQLTGFKLDWYMYMYFTHIHIHIVHIYIKWMHTCVSHFTWIDKNVTLVMSLKSTSKWNFKNHKKCRSCGPWDSGTIFEFSVLNFLVLLTLIRLASEGTSNHRELLNFDLYCWPIAGPPEKVIKV